VDHSRLLTICIYSHARWIGNLTTKRPITHYAFERCLTRVSLIPISDINPAYLIRQHQPLVDQRWNTNYHHRRTSTAFAVMHAVFDRPDNDILGDWVPTSDPIRLSSRKGRFCGRDWSKIWHAQEVCRGGKVSSQGGYQRTFSSLCSFVIC